jgi:hypothetical protein
VFEEICYFPYCWVIVITTKLKQQIEQNTKKQQPDRRENTNKKWATFTYYNPAIRKITNLFKHTDNRISYKTNNTIAQIFRAKQNNRDPEYKSGVYKLAAM